MKAETAHRTLEAIIALCGVNGILGLSVVAVVTCVYCVEKLAGVQLLFLESDQPVTLDGVLTVLGMSSFWFLEVVAAWLVLVRFSELGIYLAVSVVGFWTVCFVGIVLEVLGTGPTADHLPMLLLTAALVCWPCIAAARWLSCALLPPAKLKVAEPSAAPNDGPPMSLGNSGVTEKPPSVS